MITNTLSVVAHLVNGTVFPLLTQSPPEVALAEYLCPDVHPPVKTLVIEAATKDGKRVTLHISHGNIEASVEE